MWELGRGRVEVRVEETGLHSAACILYSLLVCEHLVHAVVTMFVQNYIELR